GALPADAAVSCAQTIVGAYPAADARARYELGKRNFMLSRPPRWVFIAELEIDAEAGAAGAPAERSAAITVRFREHGEREPKALVLARTHPHPRTLFVDPAAVAELSRGPR